MIARTLCHLLPEFPSRNGCAFKTKQNKIWATYSWTQYYELVVKSASVLRYWGVNKDSKVAIMANTRFEWAVLDWAIMGLGAQTVPIYQNTTLDDLEYILTHSETEVLIIENKNLFRLFMMVQKNCPKIKNIVCLDDLNETVNSELPLQCISPFSHFLELGNLSFSQEFNESCLAIKPKDIATLLYTSGTTGTPKGVTLSHDAAFCEVSESFPSCGCNPNDCSLSFLPYAHVLGRIEHWGHTYIGFTLAFAESIERIRPNLQEIQPTILVSVPRIFEKIYATIQSQIDGNLLQKKIFEKSLEIGKKVSQHKINKINIPLALALEYEIARKVALDKVKQAFGGRLRFAISGGAPLNLEIAEFFHACDILVLEGYGLTETTGAISVNTPYDYYLGTVGKPIGETKIKLAEDGEILISSRKVMTDYYKDPKATTEAFTDSWFHTGDIGEFTDSGHLKITDRKKDLIKTAGGKYVAPQKIENLLKSSSLIANVLVHGDQKKYIVALISLDKANLIHWAQQQKIDYLDYEELTQNNKTQTAIREIVAEANSQLAGFESIKRFKILQHEFSIESGELTPSLKVKRKFLDQKYIIEIEQLYR
jgi:long-chain acyl-CoA synthetase